MPIKLIRNNSHRTGMSAIRRALRFLYTLWLFTESDLVTFVLPNTLFGICGGLSGLLTTPASIDPSIRRADKTAHQILLRIPHVAAFNWLNLFIFDIANQRLPASVADDSLNKPWRPLPAKRISPAAAQKLLLLTITIVLLFVPYGLGAAGPESAFLVALTWM